MTKIMYVVMIVIVSIMVTVGVSYHFINNNSNTTVNKSVSYESANSVMETVLIEEDEINEI